jgi:hypothetical protein
MDWNAISAIAEILGAVAVIVTLIYLAKQIQHSNSLTTTSKLDAMTSGLDQICSNIYSNERLASIFLKGNDAPEDLSDTDAVQYSFLLRHCCNQWQKIHRLYEQGILNKSEWEQYAEEAKYALSTSGGKIFRTENPIFESLFIALDGLDFKQVSEIRLGRINSNK